MKTWISRQISYFVGILSEVGNIFLRVVLKFFFLLSVRFKSISNHIKVQFKEENPLINNIGEYEINSKESLKAWTFH